VSFGARLKSKVDYLIQQRAARGWFLNVHFSEKERNSIIASGDPVRYGALSLAFRQVAEDAIAGSLAECGVYKGMLSRFIHSQIPDRSLYLFDTFEGFSPKDSANYAADVRFRDTSESEVLERIGDNRNVFIRRGYFPETAEGLEDERFAFVMIDFDKYEPSLAALEFFYPKVNPGGFIFIHDYSNPRSEWGSSRAVNKFLEDKPERAVLLPDAWGSAVIRKSRL